MPDLLFFLILGHFLGDFAFQSDRMARDKPNSRSVLTVHVAIYTITLAAFLWLGLELNDDPRFFTWTTLIVLLLIYIEHWLQDLMKGFKFANGKQGFFIDQGLHLIVLYIVRIVVYVSP
ncbi:DUF3307 domain-containing protein [candidate division GN15 bacterium]|nr:DUF3307 domain-containing protein [candidate division GN15 bacterium]